MEIVVSASLMPTLRDRLARHPYVRVGPDAPVGCELSWVQGDGWHRLITVGSGFASILEIEDNNPLVCADSLLLPNAAGTLASIALGPLVKASLLADTPALLFSFEASESDVADTLSLLGWEGGAVVSFEPRDLGGALACTAMAEIPTPADPSDLDLLFDEIYDRVFYVRRDEDSEWHVRLVVGEAFAMYRLRYSPGDERSLLTVQVMADATGKCGAAQVVHAFNVMCGFEESLGVEL